MKKRRVKKVATDAQFKHQQIFVIEGMKANLEKIKRVFPEAGFLQLYINGKLVEFDQIINEIKEYKGEIRRPK